ncbi:AlbA family DNA-binding domain-containing protein [Desulfobacter sp.]
MVKDIRQVIQDGENSLVEFKTPDVSPQSLAEEISAFANVRGGEIFIGVSDDGRVTGIDKARIKNPEEYTIYFED